MKAFWQKTQIHKIEYAADFVKEYEIGKKGFYPCK